MHTFTDVRCFHAFCHTNVWLGAKKEGARMKKNEEREKG